MTVEALLSHIINAKIMTIFNCYNVIGILIEIKSKLLLTKISY